MEGIPGKCKCAAGTVAGDYKWEVLGSSNTVYLRVLTRIMENCFKLLREVMLSAGGGGGKVTSNKSNLIL